MTSLSLYCKSFQPDYERAVRLVETFAAHNPEGLRLYLSVPRADLRRFRRCAAHPNISLIADEDYCAPELLTPVGWRNQQIHKLSFADAAPTDLIAYVDSDYQFFRDVRASTFIPKGLSAMQAPLVVSEQRYKFAADRRDAFLAMVTGESASSTSAVHAAIAAKSSIAATPLSMAPLRQPQAGRVKAGELAVIPRNMFGRSPAHFNYMPGPVWSRAVVRELKAALLDPHGLTFRDLINTAPWENIWYGEWMMTRSAFEPVPMEPVFFHFASDDDIQFFRGLGVGPQAVAPRFVGVQLAARHQSLETLWA